MLSGPEQSILLEMEESEQRKVQLQSPNDRKTTKVEAAKDDNEKQQHLEFDLKKDKSKFGEVFCGVAGY